VSTAIPAQKVQQARDLFRTAKHTAALTGAGISTPSGIPDFRSPGSGLWEHVDPMEVASLAAFRYSPDHFYAWIHPLAQTMLDAVPNPAHLALAQLEEAGYLAGIVTQNIDNLHTRAGSREVLEIHGHLREATCVSCYTKYSTDDIILDFAQSGTIPRCPQCDGILKPNAVLFGEQLPHDIVSKAQQLFSRSDLILVVGSSLEVTPAAMLPIKPLNAGAKLIIINHEPTYLDERASVVFRQNVAVVLPSIVDEVLRERPTH
jgi:NAD-dependent deacetylase